MPSCISSGLFHTGPRHEMAVPRAQTDGLQTTRDRMNSICRQISARPELHLYSCTPACLHDHPRRRSGSLKNGIRLLTAMSTRAVKTRFCGNQQQSARGSSFDSQVSPTLLTISFLSQSPNHTLHSSISCSSEIMTVWQPSEPSRTRSESSCRFRNPFRRGSAPGMPSGKHESCCSAERVTSLSCFTGRQEIDGRHG